MQKKRVIFYLVDGARPDILNKLIAKGLLPNIKKYLVDEGSYTQGTTCFPSTTGPAYLPFLCGSQPGDHHITGIRWFDKQEFFKGRWGRNAMRSYCGYEAGYFNDDMNPEYPSLFEEYPGGLNIYNMITKGVEDKNDLTKVGKSKLYTRAHFRKIHHPVDELGHQRLMEGIERDFQFIFAVFPSVDWDSHYHHYDHPETEKAYQIADRSIGEVVDRLKAKGIYEETMIVMASDHGLTSTKVHFDVASFFKKESYRTLAYPAVWTIMPQVAVFISGNSYASVSFLDIKEDYTYGPLIEKHGKSIKKFISNPAIDFILVRKNENDVMIINENGEALIKILDGMMGYKSLSTNPLQIDDIDCKLNDEEAFDYCYDTDYPDALYQVKQLFSSHRAGDVVVSANVGYDLRDFWEIPEHLGSHGSLHKDHLYVPLLLNKPGLLPKPVRTTEIHRIIKEHLSPA